MTRYVIQFMNLDTGLWNDFGFSECREDAVAQMDRHLPGSKTVWRVVQRLTSETELHFMRGENSL